MAYKHYLEKIGWWNVEDVLIGILFVSLIKKNYAVASTSLLAFALIIFLLKFFHIGTTTIYSQYEKELKAKDEDETAKELKKVKINTTTEEIDGIKINGRVNKLFTGTKNTVKENGVIVTHSILGAIVNKSLGENLRTPPDDKWQPLFDAE